MTRAQPESFLKPKLLALSVAACFALHVSPARANPAGPTVAHGSVGFNGLGTSALTITNQAGGNAIINWNGFSIGINELTKFQQFANLAVLNRVTGGQVSSILGSLQSDGRVFLINPNGIVFGASARIDVAGMVASSLNLSDQDFLSNRLRFTEVPGAGAVVNNGVIETATGGRVYLVAPTVENNGLIQAKQGEILLAAGKEVELVDGASPFVTVKVTAGSESALNLGNLVAEGGRIGMFGALVRNTGSIEAGGAMVGPGGEIRLVATKDLTLDAGSLVAANGTSGGKVLLQAEGGTNLISGTVEAKGSAGKGGEVSALGVRVGVVGHGLIDASGDTGGGTVLMGGDYQGKNSGLQNAERTYIGSDGVIRADAMTTGDGGRVIVWADGDTSFNGNISARGGAQAGDGGFAEVSGKQFLDYRGRVDLRAPAGEAGTLLLDPQDIAIVYGIAAINPDITEVYGFPTTLSSNSPVNTVTTLTDGTINAQLALSNVVVQTGGTAGGFGDITFDTGGSDIGLGSLGSNLSFDATRNISFVGGGITNVFLNGGQLSLRAQTGSITSGVRGDLLSQGDLLALSDTRLLLVAGSGIGSAEVPLQTRDVTDLAAVSSNNGIYIQNGAFSHVNVTSLSGSDLSGSPFVEGIRTNNAPIWLETIQKDGGGNIGINSPINSGTARTTLLASAGQIYSYYGFGPSIVAGELVMSALNGIGCGQCNDGVSFGTQHPLQVQVSSLQATNQNSGVEIHNLGSLTLRDIDGSGYSVNNPNGAVIVGAEGSLTVANSITAGRRFSLVAGDHLTINADISGGPGGEGNNPSQLVADFNDDRVGSIVQSAGTAIVSNSNNLEIAIVCAFGCEQGGGGSGPSGQHITLGSVEASGDILVRNEQGGVFTNGDGRVSASRLMLRAEQGIDLDTTVGTLQVRHARKGGSGAVTIRNLTNDGETLVLDSFFTGSTAIENGGGSIFISSDGSIDVLNTVDSGSARTTLSTGDQIFAASPSFYGGIIRAGQLVLSAVNGIGLDSPIATEVSSLQATNTRNGLEIENSGDLALVDLVGAGYALRNSQGGLNISATGNITVGSALKAGRRIGLYADGNLVLNANLAANTNPGQSSAPESELFADNDADGAGSIVSAAGAGNVTTNGSSIFVTGQSVALGSINASNTGVSAYGGNGSINILANSGISTGSLTTRSLAQQYGPGGIVLLDTVDGSIVVNGDIDARGIGGSQGGSVGLSRSGTSLPAGGVAVAVNGSILASGGDGFGGGAGGTVFIGSMGGGRVQTELVATEQVLVKGDAISISAPPVMGDVRVSGTIDASGGNGGSTAVPSANVYGGSGGLVAISSYGNVSVGPIFARGGRAGDGADGSIYGNFGGSGGGVSVLAAGAATLGKIDVAGGAGGNSAASAGGSYGGSGGWGGGVLIYSLGEATINVGGTLGTTAIDASGGAGGSGNAAASPAGNGGAGGTGGSVEVIATPNMTLFGSVNTSGGAGGAGGAGDAVNLGGTGGLGGNGGSIYLDASTISNSQIGDGIIFVLAGTQFNVQGGTGGLGGAGGGTVGAPGATIQTTFLQNIDYFGTIVILDPLSVPGVNEGFQQVVKGSDDTTAFVGGEKKDEDEDKSQKELNSCKG